MSITELSQTILLTISSNFNQLMVIIAIGAGIKIVVDIVFKALYNVTSSR